MNINEIKCKLSTEFLGRNIIYYKSLESTQDLAKKMIKENTATNGTYILTDEQTKGKGTHDRKWYGGINENVTGTFILTPNCDISKLENLTIETAEILQKTIKKLFNIELSIKYPNDLLYNSKKVIGILTETSTNNGIVKWLIMGIGINVNQQYFPDDLQNIATSLKLEFSKEFSREQIISEFFNTFEQKYLDMIY